MASGDCLPTAVAAKPGLSSGPGVSVRASAQEVVGRQGRQPPEGGGQRCASPRRSRRAALASPGDRSTGSSAPPVSWPRAGLVCPPVSWPWAGPVHPLRSAGPGQGQCAPRSADPGQGQRPVSWSWGLAGVDPFRGNELRQAVSVESNLPAVWWWPGPHSRRFDQAVVVRAEQHEVVQGGRTAVPPRSDVVGLAMGVRLTAIGEGTAAVPQRQRPPDRRRHQPLGPPDVEHL